MARNEIIAYEVLARSSLDEFKNPALMFGVAERLGQEAALSELMRMEGLRIAAASPLQNARFFLNTHPAEVVNVRLLRSLETLRSQFPQTAVTIEVHEAAVTDWQSIKELRSVLESLDMQLSYDDFGAGQGRLLELCEAPPHVLKFDMQLIRDIDHAADARQDLVRSLVEVALDLGTIPLAEGIETQGEHDACLSLGFQLGQGYLYAKPTPISELQ
ncbi:MAG: EAL domain-containing protein, partial [Planctomycetales bacterium]|nr:EAL domain-containing protein [Planctomycetales bacterium]